ncbi:unnamed protein product [Clonostachys solani]|uniref:Uncharacterized protein n=1 Tax=Clonostachys solani TaxID=160281 RepID=A0A9N9ZNU7_9HYPO|nr:unnamed protein product [Clonostachys solani]
MEQQALSFKILSILRPPCLLHADDAWEPIVSACQQNYDSSLSFEQFILSALPAFLFSILAGFRTWSLIRRERRVEYGAALAAKQILVFALWVTHLILLVLWSRESSIRTRVSLPMTAVYLLATMVTAPLSWFEHTKTIKPSFLICSYLILSVLLDLSQVRTLWTRLNDDRAPVAIFTASCALRAIILLMESLPKNLTREADISRSPEDKCGVISRSLFLWMIPLLYKGYKQSLGVNDLYAPPFDAAPANLEEKLWRGWSNSNPGAKYRLLSVTAKALLPRLLAPIIPRLCVVGFMVAQPILLSHLIRFLSDSGDSRNDGYNLLAAYALVYIGLAVANAWYFHQTFKFITCVRGGLVALVYDRTMSLSSSTIDKSSAVTVMSADIERITIGLKNIHDLWANVIQVTFAAWLLERQTGVAIILPLLVAASCGYGTLKISAAAGGQQANWLKRIEKRVDVTSRTLSSMRGIKVSGFTNTLIDVIQSLRGAELEAASKFRWWQVGALVMGFFPVMISPVLTLAVFIFAADKTSQPLDASRMFVSLSTLTIMSQPLSVLFQSGPMISSMIACFDRIGRFIESQEGPDIRDSLQRATGEDADGDVKIWNGSFGWSVDSASVLEDINVTFPRGKLTMIIGPVGCGKSTLLKGLLGEVTYANGAIMLPPNSLGFCDQNPWIVNGTVEENITMFSGNDNEHYDTVLEACALLDDLKQLSHGDQSKVGSKGIALSGGQKQRVSLARTLFARRNINLFDDILIGLDSTTESHVFAAVFGPTGLLRRNKCTTILATHSVHFLPYADHIIYIGSKGNIIQQGSFTELSAIDGYVSSLGIKNNQNLLGYINPKASNIVTENNSKTKTPEPDEQDKSQKPRGVYRYYFKSIGYGMSLLYLVLATIYAFLFTFPYLWAKWWTDANSRDPWHYTGFYMGGYGLLQISCLISLVIFARHAVITIVNTSGLSLHQKLISTALHAPLSFFEKTDTGITLNRFSQDLQMVDNELPLAGLNIACSGLILIGRMLLIMNTSHWLALSFPLIILALGVLQSVYMSTSRQLRHLDLETKSPLYSQFVESLDGLASIRAFGWQGPFKELLYRNLDRSQRPFYLLLVLQRWLSVSLDCLTAAFVILLGAVMITMRDQISPGFAGVALANLIGLSGSMSTVVETWTQMETSMTSIQRIRDFERDVPWETRGYSQTTAPPEWPSRGAVEIQNLTATYKDGTVTALKNITMSIKPGEKIGICGRTGSGKTSFTLALFRMIDVEKGSISVDGLDVASIEPSTVRSGLNGIPHEPYFMPGTVRFTADHRGTSSDEEIMRALTSVRMDKAIRTKGGLDAEMEDGLFSQGEKQLFCLARSILKRSKVIVLDEATSNIDINTENLIKKVIDEEFRDFTVITVAHRLSTILNNDRVAVLEAGELVEFDTPEALLNRESRFKKLRDA